MAETKKTKKKVTRAADDVRELMIRLNRIEGQIRGIKNMVERGDYCIDIITQASAVNAALNGFEKELLATHIKTCVVEDIKNDKSDKVNELAELIKRILR